MAISLDAGKLSGQIRGMGTGVTIAAADGLTSLLFVPATRPDRIAKALATDADIVCIDLEDAVPPADKDAARATAMAAIAARVAIRVNGLRTVAGLADLLALARQPALPDLILIPMAETAAEIEIAAAVLGPGARIVPLIETPRGLAAAAAIAAAPQVAAMMFGGADFAASLGVALAWEPLAAARGLFVLACATAGVPAIDVPHVRLEDPDDLAAEARAARAMGFQGKAAIHPSQLAAIHAAMRPDAALVAEARAAAAAFATGGGGAIRHDGRMLEAPMMRRYARILARAGDHRETDHA